MNYIIFLVTIHNCKLCSTYSSLYYFNHKIAVRTVLSWKKNVYLAFKPISHTNVIKTKSKFQYKLLTLWKNKHHYTSSLYPSYFSTYCHYCVYLDMSATLFRLSHCVRLMRTNIILCVSIFSLFLWTWILFIAKKNIHTPNKKKTVVLKLPPHILSVLLT